MASSGNSRRRSQRSTCPHDAAPGPYHTCVNEHHAAYSANNLPPLLFRMDAPAFDNLPQLRDLVENGEVVTDHEGKPMRDFHFLPRYISIRPDAWLLEYWMRTDPRLTYRDIKARMAVPPSQRPKDNSLNMRRERECRNPLGLSCWTSHRTTIGRVEVERVCRWSIDQIQHNTTMAIEYKRGPDRVPVAQRLRSGTLAGGEPAYYPLDLFLDGKEAHDASRRIREALSLFWQLSERASQLKLKSWKFLPVHELPEAWRPKALRGNRAENGGEEIAGPQSEGTPSDGGEKPKLKRK